MTGESHLVPKTLNECIHNVSNIGYELRKFKDNQKPP